MSRIITIGREFGSGGRELVRRIAKQLLQADKPEAVLSLR